MQAFARIPSSYSTNSVIPGYNFSSGGYGYEGFIQPSSSQPGGENDNHEAATASTSNVADPEPRITRRAEVEDLYAVPENYLEIEGGRAWRGGDHQS